MTAPTPDVAGDDLVAGLATVAAAAARLGVPVDVVDGWVAVGWVPTVDYRGRVLLTAQAVAVARLVHRLVGHVAAEVLDAASGDVEELRRLHATIATNGHTP